MLQKSSWARERACGCTRPCYELVVQSSWLTCVCSSNSMKVCARDSACIEVEVLGSSSPGGSNSKLCAKAQKSQVHKNGYAMLSQTTL